MRFKPGGEKAYAEFAAKQSASADGQTALKFMEAWSAMMECAIDCGVPDTPEIAGITLMAAAETAGVSIDEYNVIIGGGIDLLRFWAHGEGLKEWIEYSPLEEDGPLLPMDAWSASPELLEALPKMVEAYPSILHSAPNILDICEARLNENMSGAVPMMMM